MTSLTLKHTHDVLRSLLERVTCKPGWRFSTVDDDEGFRLVILVPCDDSRVIPSRPIAVNHYFPIPVATYNVKSWRRWIFEQCRKVEDHELGEWFLVNGERPFAPLHGPGNDPYTIREVSTEEEARTNQDGSVLGGLPDDTTRLGIPVTPVGSTNWRTK
jgi:hypothetical protein